MLLLILFAHFLNVNRLVYLLSNVNQVVYLVKGVLNVSDESVLMDNATSARWDTKHLEIIRQALPLFLKEGFRAIALDKVIEGTGISKRTLYKHFRNREELAEACLILYREEVLSGVCQLEQSIQDPRERILKLFDFKCQEYQDQNYSGCLAMNAKLEYEGKSAEVELASQRFYSELLCFIEENCRLAGHPSGSPVGRQILVLFQGAIVSTKMFRDPRFTLQARELASSLLSTI